jgi:hypothetical protein
MTAASENAALCPAPEFQRYIGIDYSGARSPTSRLRGLQVFEATVDDAP